MAEGVSPNAQHGNAESTGKTFNEREFILKLLSEKRALLTALHSEKRDKQHWKGEFDRLVEEKRKSKGTEPQDDDATANEGTSQQTETQVLHKKVRDQERKIQQFRAQNTSLLNQIAVLKSEVIRLADSLSKLDVELDTTLMKEQLTLYEEDFQKEKDDKVCAQGKISTLSEELRDSKEVISNLTVEVDMYKKAYEREKKDKEKSLLKSLKYDTTRSTSTLSSGAHTLPRKNRPKSLPKPQLQVVYPVVNSQLQEDDIRRRQQLQSVGVFTRDMQRSPSYVYDDDAHVDGAYWWN